MQQKFGNDSESEHNNSGSKAEPETCESLSMTDVERIGRSRVLVIPKASVLERVDRDFLRYIVPKDSSPIRFSFQGSEDLGDPWKEANCFPDSDKR